MHHHAIDLAFSVMFAAEDIDLLLEGFLPAKVQTQAAIRHRTFTNNLPRASRSLDFTEKRTLRERIVVVILFHLNSPLSDPAILCPPFQDRAIVALNGSSVGNDPVGQFLNIVVEHIHPKLVQQ